MRRILFASVFLSLTLLLSVLVPFGNINKAYATNANVILGTNDDEDYCGANYCSGSNALKINSVTTTYATGAVIPLNINLINAEGEGGPSKKIGTTNVNTVNWTDLYGTVWDAFYDATFRTDSENGFFLVISKSKVTRTDDSFSDEVVGPGESFTIDGSLTANDQKIKTANGLGDNKGRSIGYLLYGIEPQTYFFNKLSFSPSAQISGLDPSTTYYAQIVVEEDGSDDYFWSDIVEFQTKATTDAGATPPTGTPVTGYDQTQPPPNNASGNIVDLIDCGISPSTWSGCFVKIFYNIVWVASSIILQITGMLFDAIAAVSLGSGIYSGQIATFVTSGWTIVRDIANIFFIFILLYTALGLVLSLHSVDPKKLISKVIITALLINFSLFFCRVTVDTSNILALNFYNAMDISTKGNDPSTNGSATGVNEKSISGAVAAGINPQKMMGEDIMNNMKSVGPGVIFLVIFLSVVLNLMMAWTFFMCAAFFAGRIGVIWLSMIFAPIALVTGIVPSLSKAAKRLGWEEWLSAFLKACFNAPIFMFFMYLIVRLTSETNLGTTLFAAKENPGWIVLIIAILLPAMIIIGLMQAAKKIAEEMAGEFGAAFSGIVAAGVGVAAMAATGGAAALGSKFIGGAAMKTLQNQDLKDAASGDKDKLKALQAKGMYKDYNFDNKADIARAQKAAGSKLQRADKLSKASFDVRQTAAGNMLSSATGVNMNMGAGLLAPKSFSTEQTAGGAQAQMDRKVEKENNFKQLLGQNDEKIHDLEHENSDIDEGLKKPKEDLADAEDKQQKAKNDQHEANEAIKEFREKNPQKNKDGTYKTSLPPDLKKKKEDADKEVATANASVNSIRNTPTTLKNKKGETIKNADGSDKVFNGVRGAEKAKSENTAEIEKIKTARQKAYVGYLKDQAKSDHPGDRTGREMVQAIREGFKQMASGAAKGGAAGLGIGAAGALFTGGASIAAATIGGSIAGAINGAVSGGILPAFKVAFTEGADVLSTKIAKATDGGFNKNVAWRGTYKGEKEQVAEQASHKDSHAHKFSATYKPPNSKLFDMFKGLGSSSGGGSGGHAADHGGGGDSHH